MICIFYRRDRPISINALSRLKKRLPENHPKYVEVSQDLYNYSMRFGAEERVDQEIRSVCFTNPNAVFQNIILRKHKELPQVLSNDLLQEIISTLQSQNPPFTLKPLCQQYSICPKDLKKGLFCSTCHFHLLEKSSRMYYCPNCMKMPDNPFADAMTDWFLLVCPSITNGELKAFTNSTTSTTVGYFMKSSGYVKTGNTRDRVYRFELET